MEFLLLHDVCTRTRNNVRLEGMTINACSKHIGMLLIVWGMLVYQMYFRNLLISSAGPMIFFG
jgi:hypothetical protein